MSGDSAARMTFADRMKIIQGRHLFAYYVQKQQQNKNGTNTNPLNLYPLNNETSAFTTMKIGAVNTTLEEYNKYVTAATASSTPTVQNTPPSAPTISSIVIGDEMITVYFDIPTSNGGSAINGYEYSTDDGATWTFSGSTTSPIEITGLTNGVEYPVKLRAVNSVGSGEAPPSSIPGKPATTPDAPTNLIAIPGNGSATISFDAGSNGGSEITNYEYSINGSTTFTAFSPEDINSPVTINGLTNGITYSIKLRAVNSIGNGVASSTVSVTPAGVPGAPTITSGVAGDKAIYVLFTEGSNGGSPIINYEYSIDEGATYTAFSPAQTISPLQITDSALQNGAVYNVKIRAVNTIGAGAASSSISVTPTTNTLYASNRLVRLEAADSASYSGSGTTWTNLDSDGSYSATLNGSPTYNTSDPNNKYFEFNTGAVTGQFAQITQAAAINPVMNTPFTIQLWVRINNIGSAGGALVSKVFGSPSYDGYSFYYQSDTKLVIHENGSSQVKYFTSPANVLINGWALYTANIQFGNGGGRTNKIFVNGRQVVSQISNESGIPSNNQNLTFPTGFGGEGECDIGAFYYYNTELSQEDIIRNYDATKATYGL
jgi:hypothetical protein